MDQTPYPPTAGTSVTLGGLPPPPGVIPNFINPYSRRFYIILITALCLAFTSLSVSIRIWTKFMISKSHGWEDYTSIVAWLGFIGYCILGLLNLDYGLGVHQWNVSAQDLKRFAQLGSAFVIFYAPLICITKLSILLQYQRIFAPTHTGLLYYLSHAIIWFNLALYTSVTIVEICQCIPRSKIWEPSKPGHCINLNVAFIVTAGFNVFSDFSILILPLASIWRLQMATKQKMAISVVFLTGIFACVSSIMRLVESIKVAHSVDKTFDSVPLGLWSHAEIASGIVCGCLLVAPKFFRHYGPMVKSRVGAYFRPWWVNSSTTKSSDTSKARKPLPPWYDASDPHLLQDNYIELKDAGPAISTVASGGTLFGSVQSDEGGGYNDLEKDNPDNAARKTVQVKPSN